MNQTKHLLSNFILLIITIIFNSYDHNSSLALNSGCRPTCGSLQLKYPFGTGHGCGSPRFHPYVACSATNQLLLTTHTGSYPITTISYTTSTLTITPSFMSTCTAMQQSPNIGLDWASPFQLAAGASTFLLLSCPPSISSVTINGSPVCDPSSSQLCASIYTCPSVIGLGLSLFPPTNTCCVYSPANFNGKGELDLREVKCGGYASVVSFKDYPTDPTRWEYGVGLKYTHGAFDGYYMDNKCNTCEMGGGLCGYEPSDNSFVCVCKNGINSTTDCSDHHLYNQVQGVTWSSGSLNYWNIWLAAILGALIS